MTESSARADFVLARISPDHWLFVGTSQLGKADDLSKDWKASQANGRPALLATDTPHPLLLGPQSDSGKVLYVGSSKADFLCRLRLLENTDYHWEILSHTAQGPAIIADDKLPTPCSSLVGANRLSVRWETDSRQAKGTLNYGNFLGSGWLGIKDGPQLRYEVISAKLDYEAQYLALLDDLTKQSFSLLFDPDAPTVNKPIPTEGEQKGPLEKFLLLQASLPINELRAAMGMIKARPHSQLMSEDRWMPVGMSTGLHAMADPIGRIRWGMRNGKALPAEVLERKRRDTTDTPPNRFLRFAIAQFREVCLKIKDDPTQYGQRLSGLAGELHAELEQQARLELVKTAGAQGRVPLDNQVLQKREGYRHYLRSWIVSNKTLAIRDINNDGILSPTAENRQVPDLYEYWLFFFLAEALENMPGASRVDRRYVKELNGDGRATIVLAKDDAARLTLMLGKGEAARYVALYYNRSFRPGRGYTSYSLTLRPDFTIETFPLVYGNSFEQCRQAADKTGEITYIHMDAKFRIANLDLQKAGDWDGEAASTDSEAKPEDVYKMHTYNEAIRGTAASVILFPGDAPEKAGLNQSFAKYRELIPGVGALAVSPGKAETRAKALKAVQDYLAQALRLSPKGQSAYTRFRDWEVNEVRD